MQHPLLAYLFALAAGACPLAQAATGATLPGALTLRLQAVEGPGIGVAGSGAVVDVGTVNAHANAGSKGTIQVRKRVAVRIDAPQSSARLFVSLAADLPGCTVRVDGQAITAIPRLLDPVHRIGATVVHEIELTIPANVPPGPFLGNLQWTAETD